MNDTDTQEQMRIPWQVIYEVRTAFLLSMEDIERMEWREFMALYAQVMRRWV